MGMLMLMPRTLALMAVQRHSATSRSTRPDSKVQQGWLGGVPITAPAAPFSRLAQTPSFRASLGQDFLATEGVGVGLGLGLGLGCSQVLHALVTAKRRRLTARNMAADLDSMIDLVVTLRLYE